MKYRRELTGLPQVRLSIHRLMIVVALVLGYLFSLQLRSYLKRPDDQLQVAQQGHATSESSGIVRAETPQQASKRPEQDWRSKLVEIVRIKGIPFFTQTEDISLSDDCDVTFAGSKSSDSKYLKLYLQNLRPEFDIYSEELLEKIGLRGVVLCDELTVDVRKVGGLALTQLDIVFFYVDRKLTLTISSGRAFHHEIFHLIDTRSGVTRAYHDLDW